MSRYRVFVTPAALREAKNLPGHVRQRVKKTINSFESNPRPAGSKQLDLPDLNHLGYEIRRLRLDHWRIIYAVANVERTVDILGIRRRPPYDYGDLEELLEKLV